MGQFYFLFSGPIDGLPGNCGDAYVLATDRTATRAPYRVVRNFLFGSVSFSAPFLLKGTS